MSYNKFVKNFFLFLSAIVLLESYGFSLPGRSLPKRIPKLPVVPSAQKEVIAAGIRRAQQSKPDLAQIVPLGNQKSYFRTTNKRNEKEWWRLTGLFLDQYKRLPRRVLDDSDEELFVEDVSELDIRRAVNHYRSRARQTGQALQNPQAQRFEELLQMQRPQALHLSPEEWVSLLEKYLEKYGVWPGGRLPAQTLEREVEGVTLKQIRKAIRLILRRVDRAEETTSTERALVARITDLQEKYKSPVVAKESAPTDAEIKKSIEKKINPILLKNEEKWLGLLREFIARYGGFPRGYVPSQQEVRTAQGIEEQKIRHAVDNYMTRLHSGIIQQNDMLNEMERLKKQHTRSHYMADEPEKEAEEKRLVDLAERFVEEYGKMPRSILTSKQVELFIDGVSETELRRKLNYMKVRAEKRGEDNPSVIRLAQLEKKYGFGSIDKKREEEKECLEQVEEFLINYERLPRSSLTSNQEEVILHGVGECTIRRRMNYFLARARKENRADDPIIQRLQELLDEHGYCN